MSTNPQEVKLGQPRVISCHVRMFLFGKGPNWILNETKEQKFASDNVGKESCPTVFLNDVSVILSLRFTHSVYFWKRDIYVIFADDFTHPGWYYDDYLNAFINVDSGRLSFLPLSKFMSY